jgi:lipopolysaccharide export system protein LptA
MLAGDEPLQAKAARMTSSDDNQQIRYEGNALMWQGSNRLQADRIDIDRKTGKLEAHGNVTSQLSTRPRRRSARRARSTRL